MQAFPRGIVQKGFKMVVVKEYSAEQVVTVVIIAMTALSHM